MFQLVKNMLQFVTIGILKMFQLVKTCALAMFQLVKTFALEMFQRIDLPRYTIRPEGICFGLQLRVSGAVYDLTYERTAQTGQSRKVKALTKVEMLHELVQMGFRPVDYAIADAACLTHDGQPTFLVGSLLKSRLYWEVLLQLHDIFEKGIQEIRHNGPHSYYQCLLTLTDLSVLNAIEDVAGTSDETFEGLIKHHVPKAILDLVVEGGDDVAEGGGIVLVGPLAALPPKALKVAPPPEEVWEFTCADTSIVVRLDGFSHASNRRRAYCKCPYAGHVACFRYATLAAFAEPWHAVASVVLYMRTGALTETKREHQQIPAASEAEMIAIRGEMPAALLDPAFIVELP